VNQELLKLQKYKTFWFAFMENQSNIENASIRKPSSLSGAQFIKLSNYWGNNVLNLGWEIKIKSNTWNDLLNSYWSCDNRPIKHYTVAVNYLINTFYTTHIKTEVTKSMIYIKKAIM
jgi:hypothetical protein